MRLGVVSDTHDRVSNVERIVDRFLDEGVDAVVHTGDFTSPSTLQRFARLQVPLYGVLGNNDHDRDGLVSTAAALGMELAETTLELDIAGRSVFVVHDPEEVDLGGLCAGAGPPDLVLHGHTHRYRWERCGAAWIFNPGECAGTVAGLGAVGVIELGRLQSSLLAV